MNAHFFKTPNGEEMVILPREEFNLLLRSTGVDPEDLADEAMFDSRMAELGEGKAEKLPPAVTAAMLKGDSLLKALRSWKGLTQTNMAHSAGIAQGYYSEIEKGTRRGSKDVLAAFAKALDVPVDWLA